MATETDDKTKPAAAQAEQEEPTYEADRLIEQAYDFFGEPSHVVAGALSTERKKNFTRDEAKSLIKAFLKRPVEVDNDGSEEG